MHQQRHAELLHALEHRIGLADIGDAGIGMRGGARRIELHAVHEARCGAPGRSPRARCVSVKYSVISGSKRLPAGKAARIRSR